MLAWLMEKLGRKKGPTQIDLEFMFCPLFQMGFDNRFAELTRDAPIDCGRRFRKNIWLRLAPGGFVWRATIRGGSCVLVRPEKRHEFPADYREIGKAFHSEGEKAAEAFVAMFRIDGQAPS